MNDRWMHSAVAHTVLRLSNRTSLRKLIEGGVIRAEVRQDDTVWVHEQDVEYCRQRARDKVPTESLVARGLIPAALEGRSGKEIVDWARQSGRQDLLPDPNPVAHAVREVLSRGAEEPPPGMLDLLDRVHQLEGQIGALVQMLGPSATQSLLPDADKPVFLSELELLVDTPVLLTLQRALDLLGRLRRLDISAIQDLADWCASHESPLRYLVLLDVARQLRDFFHTMSASKQIGSVVHRALVQTEDLRKHLTSACLGVEGLRASYAARRSGSVPLGYCRTDINLMDTLRKRIGIGT